ncbi:MAG: hypothetical protein AAF982_12885, partial [Pseudomonadota bacterium]
DPGGQDDLLALSVIGRHAGTGVWQHWAHLWAHEIVLERRKSIAASLENFAGGAPEGNFEGTFTGEGDLRASGIDDTHWPAQG